MPSAVNAILSKSARASLITQVSCRTLNTIQGIIVEVRACADSLVLYSRQQQITIHTALLQQIAVGIEGGRRVIVTESHALTRLNCIIDDRVPEQILGGSLLIMGQWESRTSKSFTGMIYNRTMEACVM